jgi:hypothetical protein
MIKTNFAKIIFIVGLLFTTQNAFAEMVKNAGFTGPTILTTNSTPVIGETVRLSMPIYNETKGVITATVRLYENDKKIAEKNLTLKAGEFSGFNTEWKAVSGVHNFEIKLEDTFLQLPKSTKNIVVLENRYAKIAIKTQGEGASSVDDSNLLKEYTVSTEEQSGPTDTGLDSYRQDFLYDAENKITSIRQDISESVKQNAEYEKRLNELRNTLPRADGSLLTPLQYLYAWALGALAYILSNAWLFYGVSIFILFIIARFIFRKIRSHHSHLTHR